MKKLYTLFALVVLCLGAFSQRYCGFDAIREAHINMHHLNSAELDQNILERVLQMRQSGGDEFVIPIVAHVIHENGPENISVEQVEDAVDALNDAFANTGDYFEDLGVDVGIQFCLAGVDPDGDFTTGVNYVEDALTDVLVPSQELELKDLSRWDPTLYLNLWIVKEITREADNAGVVGFATFPDSHGSDYDGLVIEANYVGSDYQNTKVVMHEVGHYLGLFHTFQDACPNDDCLLSGDRVCDTPPDSHVFTTFCFDGTNSCTTDEDDTSDNNPFRPVGMGGLGDQLDMQTNYMDYSNLVCFRLFTEGQKERMNAALIEYRSSLLEGDRCTAPCDSPIDVDAFVDNDDVLVNEQVNFTNNSTGYVTVEWYIDGQLVSSNPNFNTTFDVQGEYLVELVMTNADPGCDQELSWTIMVTCPITAEITAEMFNVSTGGEVDFTNLTIGADTFTWYLDNTEIGIGIDQTVQFPEPGLFSVYLIADNGECEVQSNVIDISVGSCITGNEANRWYFLNEFGSLYGFNFNEDPMELVASAPGLGVGHSKSALSDENGDLLFLSRGVAVYDGNFDILQNGDNLDGHISSHFGTIFVKKPLSDTEYYVFTSTAELGASDDGVRYSVIDATLNGGLGGVTAVKNVPIEVSGTEPLTCIRHCNLTDFWLVFYDNAENGYKAYLVTNDGVADDAVFSPITNPAAVETIAPLRVNPQGTMIAHKQLVLDFNPATGVCSLYHEFDFDLSIGYDWSPNGKFLYQSTGEFTNTLWQLDMTLPASQIQDQATTWAYPDLSDLKFFVQRAPDGKIYMEEAINGSIDVIHSPNLPGEACDIEDDAFAANALLNSFGNYYHAYVDGQSLFLNGPDIVCQFDEVEYGMLNWSCLLEDVTWEVEGATDWTDLGNGGISVVFDELGIVTITASVQTDCGLITDSFEIEVLEGVELELGPDQAVCIGIPVTLDAGGGWQTYDWSTNESTQTIDVSTPGVYNVIVTLGSCEAEDEIEITEEIVGNIDLGDDFDMCDGEVVVLDIGSGWADPVWQDGWIGPTYTVYEGGTYSVSTTLPCPASDEVYVDDCGQVITEIEELISTAGSSAYIYPSPSSGDFMINMSAVQAGNVQILVHDATGKLVDQRTRSIVKGPNQLPISLDVAAGLYVINIMFDDHEFDLKLVIE